MKRSSFGNVVNYVFKDGKDAKLLASEGVRTNTLPNIIACFTDQGSRGDGGGAFVVSDHHDDLAVYFLLSLTVPIRRLLIIINFPAFHSAAALAPNRFRD